MWTCATGQESAARRLYDPIDGGADAAAMYEKSIALNPENRNGQEALARIRAAAAQ
jgi:hypothetical protein